MKKVTIVLLVAAAMFFDGNIFADTLENLTFLNANNLSFPQNAEKDVTALHNPAGTAFVSNGLYLYLGNISVWDKASITEPNGDKLTGKSDSIIVPSLAVLYKMDTVGLFLNAAVYQGGGSMKFDQKSPSLHNKFSFAVPLFQGMDPVMGADTSTHLMTKLKGSSNTIGVTLGGSYKINEMFSAAIGGRLYSKTGGTEWTARVVGAQDYLTLDYKDTISGTGYAGVIGFSVIPLPALQLGITYESKSSIKMKKKVNTANVSGTSAAAVGFTNANINLAADDGQTFTYDVPAVLKTGVKYTVVKDIEVAANFNYSFNKQSKKNINTPGEGLTNIKDAYEATAGIRYTIMPELKIGIAALYAYVGTGNTEGVDNYALEGTASDCYGGSLSFQIFPIQSLTIDLNVLYAIYDSIDINNVSGNKLGTYKKDRIGGAFGVTYKI